MTAANRVDGDPAPPPPVRPVGDDCCRSGCMACVVDLYEAALACYRIALKAWRQRQLTNQTMHQTINPATGKKWGGPC